MWRPDYGRCQPTLAPGVRRFQPRGRRFEPSSRGLGRVHSAGMRSTCPGPAPPRPGVRQCPAAGPAGLTPLRSQLGHSGPRPGCSAQHSCPRPATSSSVHRLPGHRPAAPREAWWTISAARRSRVTGSSSVPRCLATRNDEPKQRFSGRGEVPRTHPWAPTSQARPPSQPVRRASAASGGDAACRFGTWVNLKCFRMRW